MSDKANRLQILNRGHDLTADDLETIAEDMRVVLLFCMRHRLRKGATRKQLTRALEARLGRRPLVIAPPVGRVAKVSP